MADIIAANPNIFGPSGKIAQVQKTLGVENVIYIPGNHDMGANQSELLGVLSREGHQISASPGDIHYLPPGEKGMGILSAHGHQCTMFNASYYGNSPWGKLPVGHFVTRSVAYMLKRTLKPGQTAADLPDQGAPNGIDLSALLGSISPLITETLLNYVAKVTGMPDNQPIILPDGQQATIAQARVVYNDLWTQWVNMYGGGVDGGLVATKAAIADFNGDYMGWFAQKFTLEQWANIAVMGHTHVPKLGLKESLIQYVNSGFMCPSKPDIGKRPPTFAVINADDGSAQVLKVVEGQGFYKIEPCTADQASFVVPPTMDFSCYVIVDNTNGKLALNRVDYNAEHGHYVVTPPQRISPGELGRFWLQDYPGIYGSEGRVTYSPEGSSGGITLTYDCPTGLRTNYCSGANFYTRSDGNDWGALNEIALWGHPFFVRFVF